ncbi:EscF/YscF/HrpA family type III secretion system needle major subunit [Propionivibrio dicarboxylicus]|uniref:Type III secretion protein F n=1 Tax=Propionivibrio dicarboxylicus TaxID=83767 RepID=A0A1G7WSQ9_9RHOO|nr:EscF/YscF/HrpA family type III secretion system needle major subunit [Propionivibrio dicarboxylicus]SDG74934.1 type III secretion protein F [Propionivibrio dicarboxylicus]
MTINNLNFDYVGTTVANVIGTAESALKAKISTLDSATASPAELLLLQQDISKWAIMTEIQSTLVKTISDAMKGIIQKSG